PLLVHSTIVLAISLLLKWRLSPQASAGRRPYTEPLTQSALVFSIPALSGLMFAPETALKGCLGFCWLAGLWLAMAVQQRQRILFTAFQLVLMVATIFGVTAWLESQGFSASLIDNSWDARVWQSYGIGLALLSLLWMSARIGLQSNQRAQELLEPSW